MAKTRSLISLDVGEKRIGVAAADSSIKIAFPLATIVVDGSEIKQIAEIVLSNHVDTIVIGYPRNQAGESTQQTHYVKEFASQLSDFDAKIVYQDESLTSVLAEERLQGYGKSYTKEDIDAVAASIILQDYLERNY